MPPRRAAAPRLIDWTGERLVPWAPDAQLVYEHFHRYLWAQPIVAGRRVLDLGSGEGFGAALLADTARAVVGVDIDERTIEHSRLNYAAANLEFQVASATRLGKFPDDAFDAVVAFEVIEHVADHEGVLAEMARVLAPGGLVLVSTPEREAYSEARGCINPYHERELTQQQLVALLRTRFAAVKLFAQGAVVGSRIEALETTFEGRHHAVRIERSGDDWRPAGPAATLYMLAVASDDALPELPAASSLSDYGLSLVRDFEARAEAAEAARVELEHRLRAEHDRLVGEVLEVGNELAAVRQQVADREVEIKELRHSLAEVHASVTWRLLERARGVLYGVIDRDSIAGRAISRILRTIGRVS